MQCYVISGTGFGYKVIRRKKTKENMRKSGGERSERYIYEGY